MPTSVAYSSEEEWCLLSDADDEVESEPELVPRYTSARSTIKQETSGNNASASFESSEVLSLLPDALPSEELVDRRVAAYSRAIRLSLLSNKHRTRLQGVDADTQAPSYDGMECGRSTATIAFQAPEPLSTQRQSFPDRLRETTASFRDSGGVGELCTPMYSPVDAFVVDQATQTDRPTPSDDAQTQAPATDASRVGLFRAALERTFALSAQLHAKSKECERLSLRAIELQRRLDDGHSREQAGATLQSYRRSMAIANERLALGLEYQGRLQNTIADLTDKNESLKRQTAILSGQQSDLRDQSVLKLEALEDALTLAMDNVRSALRDKYRAAVAKAQLVDTVGAKAATSEEEEARCVVCLAQAATVKATPCGHQVLCPACAVRIDTCPIDRLPMTEKVLAFGLDAYRHAAP